MGMMDKPKRPCSIYNLFYQIERECILHELIPNHCIYNLRAIEADIRRGKDVHISNDEHLRPRRYRHLILASNWFKSGKRVRKHRKTECVLGFNELNKLISSRWEKVDSETKRYLRSISDKEWAIYREKSKLYKETQLVLRTMISNEQKEKQDKDTSSGHANISGDDVVRQGKEVELLGSVPSNLSLDSLENSGDDAGRRMSMPGFFRDEHGMHRHITNPFSCVTRNNHHAMTVLRGRQVRTLEKEQASLSHGVNKKGSQYDEPYTSAMIRQVSDMLPTVGAIKSNNYCGNQAERVFPMSTPLCVSMSFLQGNDLPGYTGEKPYEPQSNEASPTLTQLPDPSNGTSKDYNCAAPVLYMGALCQLINSPVHAKEHHIPIDDVEVEECFAFPPRSFHPVADSVLHMFDVMPGSLTLEANDHSRSAPSLSFKVNDDFADE